MTASQIEKLTALQRRGTRHELILTDGSTSYRIAYAARNNRSGLIASTRAVSARVFETAGSEKGLVTFGKRAADPVAIDGTVWSIRWSGRTEREAIIAGELPYVPSTKDLPGPGSEYHSYERHPRYPLACVTCGKPDANWRHGLAKGE